MFNYRTRVDKMSLTRAIIGAYSANASCSRTQLSPPREKRAAPSRARIVYTEKNGALPERNAFQ
jgi:hypothetical protein